MKIAIFSDLHLKNEQVTLRRKFSKLLVDLLDKEKITHLWLLGDIFDLLIGNYQFWFDHYRDIFEALQKLKAGGVKILWMEGNHDFHLTKLLGKFDVDVADGELSYLLNEHGPKVYLAHGDLVNSEDVLYLKWRELTRSAALRKTLDWVPNILAKKYLLPFAETQSARSRKYSSLGDNLTLKTVYQDFARKKFSEGFHAVIMGHCHIEDFLIESDRFYLNLGSALDGTLRYAIWDLQSERFPKVYIYSKMNR